MQDILDYIFEYFLNKKDEILNYFATIDFLHQKATETLNKHSEGGVLINNITASNLMIYCVIEKKDFKENQLETYVVNKINHFQFIIVFANTYDSLYKVQSGDMSSVYFNKDYFFGFVLNKDHTFKLFMDKNVSQFQLNLMFVQKFSLFINKINEVEKV